MATLLAPNLPSSDFSIREFLANEHGKDLLRFSTAGSVDDGKSTLIGRLLYDTQSVYEDQVRSIEGKGTTSPGQIDFALLTDGLRAEREQGITIDVAYRYFSTARRKFIIADTPGHEQYTRNMATGASTADATVVLIDARKGVLLQSRRHAYIASLLRVKSVLVAVNKMDLVNYGESTFRSIEQEFQLLLKQISADTGNNVSATFVPVSALNGDNIVYRSSNMPWYGGPSLLELLESLPSAIDTTTAPFRFAVQRVIRPDLDFRGFAGQIASGSIHPGDEITVLPSNKKAKVARIVTFDGDLIEAFAPSSITLTFDRELDISRGDVIVSSQAPATVTGNFKAALVWMDSRPLDQSRLYLLKHLSQTVPASVIGIDHRTNIGSLSREPAITFEMNGIGVVDISVLRPIAIDLYRENRSTGAFILIDSETNSTVAAGMIAGAAPSNDLSYPTSFKQTTQVTAQERLARWGHRGAVVELSGPPESIDQIERSLFELGAVTIRMDAASPLLAALKDLTSQSGLMALVVHLTEENTLTAVANGQQIKLPSDDANLSSAIIGLLRRTGIMNTPAEGTFEGSTQ